MRTVLVATDRAELALAESALRELSIPFVKRNAVLEDLYGGGASVGFGPEEIRVADADFVRANDAIGSALGPADLSARPAELEPEATSPAETEARAAAIRYARWSAVWSMFALWGIGSLLGIYFGTRSLRLSRDIPPSQKGLAIFGVAFGALTLLWVAVSWVSSLSASVR
jgi:hypothetical protein